MDSEARLYEIIEKLRGKWEIKTDWGVIDIALRPLRIHYGKMKGTPDEIIIMNVSFPLFGELVTLQAPVLLEVEKRGGISASLDDLRKFSERSQAGEQESYIELPMLVFGKERKSKRLNINVNVKINMKEVPKHL